MMININSFKKKQKRAQKQKVKLAKWASAFFKASRYKVAYGGRGSGKSTTIAMLLVMLGAQKKLRILCGREFQNSITESVYKLLVDCIERCGLQSKYRITNNGIFGKNGTEFLFKGVRNNIASIKSMEAIDILWLEEAQTISQASWDILVPTIRKAGSEIWASFNPTKKDDPIYKTFVNDDGSPKIVDGAIVMKVNYKENPWFTEELERERKWCQDTDQDKYLHVWEGYCRTHSDAQIFKGKFYKEKFEPENYWMGPYHGADFGFAQDPSTIAQVWIDPKRAHLCIRREGGGKGIDIDFLPEMYRAAVPDIEDYIIKGDSARPDTISYVSKNGIWMEPCKKGEGSVEDGISFMRSFKKIIVHEDCVETYNEFINYSHKVDRMTDRVLPDIVDDYNHWIDAIRYALDDIIKSKLSILDVIGEHYEEAA